MLSFPTLHNIMRFPFSALHTFYFRCFSLHSPLFTLTLHALLFIALFTLRRTPSTLISLFLFSLSALKLSLCTLHAPLFVLHSSLFTLHSPPSTLQPSLVIIHFPLSADHSPLPLFTVYVYQFLIFAVCYPLSRAKLKAKCRKVNASHEIREHGAEKRKAESTCAFLVQMKWSGVISTAAKRYL